MSILAKIKYRHMPWAQRLLGLFVVASLAMTLQSCSMAQGNDHIADWPRCLQSLSQEMPSFGPHDVNDKNTDNEFCVLKSNQCSYSKDFKYDRRSAQFKVKDAPTSAVADTASANNFVLSLDSSKVSLGDRMITQRPCGARPLNILHCIYLI